MRLGALLLAAALADSITMLMLPHGSERNPVAASHPIEAIALKVALALILVVLMLRRVRYFRAVGKVGIVVWLIGTASNLAVLL